MKKIAKDSQDFFDKVSRAEIKALNTPLGLEITAELRRAALEENPNMTTAEWSHIKEGFVAYVFNEFIQKFPDMKAEFAEHIYNDLIKREEK